MLPGAETPVPDAPALLGDPVPNVGFVLGVLVAPGGGVDDPLDALPGADDGDAVLPGEPGPRWAGVTGGVLRVLSPGRSLVSTSGTRDSCPLLRCRAAQRLSTTSSADWPDGSDPARDVRERSPGCI
ncbi:hypothetical protein GCM10009539_01500 [Cryptosporangium japonicum]|uniref:Uncharacterized protein n=1 Tax=Cryptosporangium japonicum TaxID=80872 RepID=A0ABP3D093_9ACTN